ncbi:CDP-alcohol phosphatidyltransferase family protein [Psychromonas ossibalaenae]|uniref:CDP-alcohol phosphatidyltransferase family protein n=1 Tax=Psychromonas ossibalaenae TaxID=444922 RepID=UPI00036EA6E9|nr:CDP-alcohol phosphatidyltransferase family protein [Psychromonas ossibalaenae]
MLDRFSIKVISTPLNILAAGVHKAGIKADQVTLTGFILGLLAFPALIFAQYQLALLFILINRVFDGLDGAVARIQGITDSGGFLDITLDFLFYSLIPFGFILAAPDMNAVAGAFLIFSFLGTGSSFLAFAVMAGKRNIENPVYKHKSLYYIGGLTEGTETIACFILLCLLPEHFSIIAYSFALLCWITTFTRIWAGYQTLKVRI